MYCVPIGTVGGTLPAVKGGKDPSDKRPELCQLRKGEETDHNIA